MSNLNFPSLPGLAWGLTRKPKWASRIQRSVSGKRQAIGYMSTPLYEWTLSFNVLREYSTYDELATLQGFFNQMRGPLDTFYFADPHDAVVGVPTPYQIGVGNGTQKLFQAVRNYGGFVEPIYYPALISVYVNGVVKAYTTDWQIDSFGMIIFVVAPPVGHSVTISGTFKYRCAFTSDSIELINSDGVDVWKSSKITLESIKP